MFAPVIRTGWPWAEENVDKPGLTPEGRLWPRISIVTPSFNQAQFLEETIHSVLLQDYPNVEYIIIDGGSTDGSVEIIRKYERWLACWVSERDRGQAHAINKGLERATGTLVRWLNSDDLLLPGSLAGAAMAHLEDPDAIIAGDTLVVDGDGRIGAEVKQQGLEFRQLVEFWTERVVWDPQGLFFPARLAREVGPMDEGFRYAFDYDWMCRALQVARVRYLGWPVAGSRRHPETKTVAEGHLFLRETSAASRRYWPHVPGLDPKAHDRYLAARLFYAGCSRVLHSYGDGWLLMAEGLSLNPVSAVASALRRVPSYLRRKISRFLADSMKPLP